MIRIRTLLLFILPLLLSQLLYHEVYSFYGTTLINEMYGSQQFLFVDLFAFNDGAGLGNLVFELVGTIVLARKLERSLVVHRTVYDKMQNKYPEFNNLISEMQWNVSNEIIPFGAVFNYQSYHCCRFNPRWESISPKGPVTTVKVAYIQSFKYFESIDLSDIRHLLAVNETLRSIAREGLIPISTLNNFDHKLCVHSRRGDFLHSFEQAPSTQEFTVPAVDFVLRQLKSKARHPLVVMMGDDLYWQRETAKKIKSAETVVLPRSASSTSASIDWQFSEMHCDTVLLTAAASTFGWWTAYVSKGQQVYYNSIYGKQDRFGDHLDPHEFFPNSWTSLELDRSHNEVIGPRLIRS
ncbi:hypothetical protein PMAYCL1PPCAC_29897 [Pristionchus mayeri]|uniref:L-Fucosyltransferase n=1 Tax=Pristionchus mayeri TaxID=1317129 RepID=A0AAN5DBV1_9BILA|nr:hypothetical protein PMAYCL1PPCAC_29897 [Pristionchus mayeri]